MAVLDAHSTTVLDDETLRELGLTQQPFQEDKKRQPVADETTLKTRAALEQHVRFGESLNLLIGEDNSGKTVLLQQLLKHCKNSIKPFVVKGSADFQANAFLYAVLSDLTNEEITAESVDELIDALAPIFEQITADQLSALLIVDDAHLAPMEEIAELVDTLQHFSNEEGKTARLLLTGTPALSQSIARFEAQFEDLNLQYGTTTMQPLDEARTREYLSTRLHQAGFADAFPFTDKAISKIQRDSDGLPGRINETATHYLNGVYRNGGADTSKSATGWLSGFEWPVLALGAAALAAIGLGLSMFFGNKPETEVIPVPDTAMQIEQPVVAPSAAPSTNNDATTIATQEPLVNPPLVKEIEPSFQSNTEAGNNTAVAGTANQSSTVPDTTIVEAVKETIVDSVDATDNSLARDVQTPALQAATPELTNTPADTTILSENTNAADFTTPTPSGSNAQDKSIGSTNITLQPADQLSDNALLSDNSVNTSNSNAAGNSSIAGNTNSALLDGDTDAAATALESENTLATNPSPVATPVAATDATSESSTVSTRAIENERWVLYQTPDKFTVQLATSRERSYIIDLAQTMEMQDPVAIYPFLTKNSNNPVFGLLSGLYDTRAEAVAAVASMSEGSKKFGVWIRPVSELQEDIKRRQ